MWSEEKDIDRIIREAAETDSHGFEEKSWQKMEGLLNKHLPQEKNRRRFIFLLLFLLLAGIPAALIIDKFSIKNTTITEEQKNIPSADIVNTQKTTTTKVLPENRNTVNPAANEKSIIDNSIPGTGISVNAKPVSTSQNKIAIREKIAVSGDKEFSFSNIMPSKKEERELEDIVSVKTDSNSTFANSFPADIKKAITVNPVTDKPVTDELHIPVNNKDEDKVDPTIALISNETAEKEKSNNKKSNKISFNFSLGADVSSIGMKTGNGELQYGAGIGYSFSDRWTIRTGFYAGRKKYAAKPSDYHPPYDFWSYYPNMQRIDANCYVYEIPVTVVYNFVTTKNHNWFLSTGLSSYLMKKEIYDYTYKNPSGQIRQYTHTYENEYAHIFSIVNLSGGYQYHLTPRFSLLAEPYIKMPLSGIGFGKVNLNSAGILFTAGFKPFLKTKETRH